MSYMPLGMEATGILASATLTLFSILVAVIGVLLAMYSGVVGRESYIKKPYEDLIVFLIIILIIGGIGCFSSIAYLLGVFQISVGYLMVISLILMILMIIIGVFRAFITIKRTSGNVGN